MEKQKKSVSVKFRVVIGCILAVLLFAAPCSALVVADVLNIGYGYEVQQVDYPVVLGTGTLNLYPGAEVYSGIMALGGSTINFHGGQMSAGSYVRAFSSATNPEITVYGTSFVVNKVPCDPSATSFILVPGTYSVLTGFYGNGDSINLKFYGNIPINLVTLDSGVAIDIKPGSDQNIINLKSRGVVPVAVLTTDDFDATQIDAGTVKFAGAAPVHWKFADVDEDGDVDMMFHFRTQQLELDQSSTEATLTAQLTGLMTTRSIEQASGGATVSGTDKVKIVSSNKSKK
jgi:hypothetical protein